MLGGFLSVHLCGQQVDWRKVVVFMGEVYSEGRTTGLGSYLLLHRLHLLILKHKQGGRQQSHYTLLVNIYV